MKFPSMVKITQEMVDNSIQNIEVRVKSELQRACISALVKPRQRIALTISSRPVANIVRVLRTAVDTLKACGAEPYIVFGMGGHGGGTVEGQMKIAEKLGVTEAAVGAPLRPTMDVVCLGSTPKGIPVYIDRYAAEADGLIIVHRVEPHRYLMGPQQSGLLKMLAIGLGKLRGAATVHSFGWEHFAQNVVEVSSFALEKTPVILGIAMVENGFRRTAHIEAVKPSDFISRNAALLQMSLGMIHRIPFEKIDVLVVKEFGKNMPAETDIIGRAILKHYTEVVTPNPTRTVVLDLHNDSIGNAAGMGAFHYTTQRFLKKIDFRITTINCIAANVPEAGLLPLVLDNDHEAIGAALQNSGFPDIEGVRNVEHAKMVIIKNTHSLQTFYASSCLVEKAREETDKIRIIGNPFELPFDHQGNFIGDFETP
jgi:hypothetical protein